MEQLDKQDKLKYVYPQTFEIIWQASGNTKTSAPKDILAKLNYIPHKDAKSGVAVVNGKAVYSRVFILPTIKEEDRTHEVIDEDTDTIYVVPEWMIPTIIEQIEYERMTKDWKKTNNFNSEQIDILRIFELVLYKQGEDDLVELLKMNRLEKKAPEVYDFQTLYDKAMDKIDKDILRNEIRRIKPIYKLRGEILPQIFIEKENQLK